MALASPGIQISINDQSQYVNSNIGSVPFVVLATAQDKKYNGSAATGTSKANAGKLLSFTSQRDLVTQMGTPNFQFSAANTPVNGSELNEYGLLTAYSALGISNQLFAIRADIDLAQLTGTSNRPFGNPVDGTYWLDLANTQWGLYELNRTQDGFTPITPLLITDVTQVRNDSNFAYPVPTPKNSVGTVGSYALVFVGTDGKTPSAIRLFYKADSYAVSSLRNTWVQVGSPAWRQSVPSVISTVNQPIATSSGTLTMLTGAGTTETSITVSLSGVTSMTTLRNAINSAANSYGVYAEVNSSGYLELYVTNAQPHIEQSTGETSPALRLYGGTNGGNWTNFGFTSSPSIFYVAPGFSFRTYANLPQWLNTDSQPHPPGSVLWKISSTGGGWNPALKKYNASLDKWTSETIPYFVPLQPNDNTLPALKNVSFGSPTANGYFQCYTTRLAIGQQVIVTSTVGGQLDQAINAGVSYSYYIISTNYQNTFTLSQSPNGAAIVTTSNSASTSNLTFQLGTNVGNYDEIYYAYATAIYGLDSTGGGSNIGQDQFIATKGAIDTTSNELIFSVTSSAGITKATGGQLSSSTPFNIGDSFHIISTKPGTYLMTDTKVSLYTTTIDGFVSDALNALADPYTGNPSVVVVHNTSDGPNGSLSFIHTTGGEIILQNDAGQILSAAKFATGAAGTGYTVNSINNYVSISNFTSINKSLICNNSAPYTAPANGTLWYYSNESDVDIMINDNGWKGYQNVTSDARGYNLSSTDKNGVIISAGVAPTSQYNGNSLAAGDLWLDSSDLVNYPKLYRYNGASWISIHNTDQVSSSGIVFADARWDTSGTTDIISGNLPMITDGVSTGLLFSNYLDQDAPDYRLYPRGALLFNTRRSGYNVKKFVSNYFNPTTFSTPGNIPGTANYLPEVANTWVTASGLKNDGSMYAGSAAQRAMIVAAMKSAIDSNLQIRETVYNFNLLCVPGYPEVIPNLVNLNNNRSNTGFIIGDTPLTLAPDTVSLTQWVNNTNSNGLPATASSDAYTAIYYPSGLANDLSGNTVVVPASHAVLRTFLYNDNVSYPWFAPAGVTRGLVSNLNDIGYIDANTGRFVHNGIGQGVRDSMYNLKINPLTQLPGVGLVVWGQQTRNGSTTARSNVNVVRLENYLRTIFTSISNGYLFEPNDTVTRKSIATQIESALHDILSKRGIYDFLVICDTSNNTASTVANNQLYVDVAVEPTRDVEFIYIPIALYNPGTISTLQASST